MRLILSAICIFALSSCTAYQLVKSGKHSVGGLYTFETDHDWSKHVYGPYITLTLDGPTLQFVHFTDGIKDKEFLFQELPGKKLPPYKKSMTVLELRDFIRDSFISIGAEQFELQSFEPYDFVKTPGFKASFTFLTEEGLAKRGEIVGTQKDDKLYTISYVAASLHYYGKTRGIYDAILQSVKPIKKS